MSKRNISSGPISQEDSVYLQKIYPTVAEVFKKPGYQRVIEASFGNVYPAWKLQQDIQEIGRKQAMYDKDEFLDRIKGEILEAVLLDTFELNSLLENVFIQRSALHDDYEHGTDLWFASRKIFARRGFGLLGVDVTTARKFSNKVNRSVRRGGLTTAEYFSCEDLQIPPCNTLKKILHVVIHIDNGILAEFTRLWLETKKRSVGSNKELYENPIQFIILKQIIMQLEIHLRKKNNLMGDKTREECKSWLTYFVEIYERKILELSVDKDFVNTASSIQRMRHSLQNYK